MTEVRYDFLEALENDPQVVFVTASHMNKVQPKWIRDYGLTIVFLYTPSQSTRSLVKAVRRLKRTMRKKYGREGSRKRMTRLVLHYVWSGNPPEVLDAYKKAALEPFNNPVNPLWLAPAGTISGDNNG